MSPQGSTRPAACPTAVRHPCFARACERLSAGAERRGRAEHRRALLAGLAGRVLDVGVGTGLNFAHFPQSVREVVGIEPEPYLRVRAEEAALRAPVPARAIDAVVEDLPFADGSFDAAVVCAVLCSVRQATALAELLRVLAPGGQLRFYEHVRADTAGFASPRVARVQRLLDRGLWPRLAGGCHLAKDTTGAIRSAGFEIVAMRRLWFPAASISAPVAPHVLGTARRPGQ